MRARPLTYAFHGSGPRDTLLLHGLLGSRRSMSSLARCWSRAAPDRRIIVPDLTGHGESPSMPKGASLFDLALDVISLARAMTRGPIDLAGHSLGGRVALKSLEIGKEHVGAVIMLDIGPGPVSAGLVGGPMMRLLVEAPSRYRSRKEARDLLIFRGLDRTWANWMALNLGPAKEEGWVEWRIDREAVARFHERQSREDLWPVLKEKKTRGRVICIRGGASSYVSDADAEHMKALGVRMATIPGAGHFFTGKSRDELACLLSERT